MKFGAGARTVARHALSVHSARLQIPSGAQTSSIDYRVPFYDTDAMGIVHHANYVRYLELARVAFSSSTTSRTRATSSAAITWW